MRERKVTTAAALASRWLPWALALAGCAFDIAAYWPGQMSFDSAYAWWQARGGTTTDIVPPLFVRLWRLGDLIVDGPGALFTLHLGLFWAGLALLMRALRFTPLAAAAAMLVVAFAPVPLLLRGQVWTDVGLFAALTFATGALACAHADGRRLPLLAALPALVYATGLRHNALPAIVPFALWFAWSGLRGVRNQARPPAARVTLAALALLLAMGGSVRLLETRVDQHVPLWPALAQWDLAAVSIATDHMLLPDFMIGRGLDVAELGAAFNAWGNLFRDTRHGIRGPFEQTSDVQLARLRGAWINAIATHPRAWLAHRWRVTRGLFGTHAPEWPRELTYVDDEVRYRDNPPVARNPSPLHRSLMQVAARLLATPALAPWPYLALGLIGGGLAWRRRDAIARRCALVVLSSAWLYALPLSVLAPSVELRYLAWPCVASLLAFACVFFAPRGLRPAVTTASVAQAVRPFAPRDPSPPIEVAVH